MLLRPAMRHGRGRGPVWEAHRADSQVFASLPSAFAQGRGGSPSWGAFNAGFNNSFHMSFLLTWGERGAGEGCVRETHWYGNHILPVIYLRNMLVRGGECSDSARQWRQQQQRAPATASVPHHRPRLSRPAGLPSLLPPSTLRGKDAALGSRCWVAPHRPPLFSRPQAAEEPTTATLRCPGEAVGTQGERTASFPRRNRDFQLWPGARFVAGSPQYYTGPSLPPSCWNRRKRWARWWLTPNSSARAGTALLRGRAGCVKCFTNGDTIASLCSWAAAGFGSPPSLDLLRAWRSMLAQCGAWGASPFAPGDQCWDRASHRAAGSRAVACRQGVCNF